MEVLFNILDILREVFELMKNYSKLHAPIMILGCNNEHIILSERITTKALRSYDLLDNCNNYDNCIDEIIFKLFK